MNVDTLSTLIDFNSSIKSEKKKYIFDLFLETWEKIQKDEDKYLIEERLEFVIVRPMLEDENISAFAFVSPTSTSDFNKDILTLIYREKLFLDQKQDNIYRLAHEFSHVFLQHSYIGKEYGLIGVKYQIHKLISEIEAEFNTRIYWGIRPTEKYDKNDSIDFIKEKINTLVGYFNLKNPIKNDKNLSNRLKTSLENIKLLQLDLSNEGELLEKINRLICKSEEIWCSLHQDQK